MLKVRLLLVAVALLLVTGEAAAARGVSVDLGRIEVEQGLLPGGGYRLPTIGVRNPGSEPTTYRMVVSYLTGQKAKRPPADWFVFSPREFSLGPGETKPVNTRINLPTGADPGDYGGLVGAQIVSKGDGAQVGAAAAARITFTVAPSSWLEAQWLRLKTFFAGHLPWSWLVPSLAAGTLTAWLLRRRFTISIGRRA